MKTLIFAVCLLIVLNFIGTFSEQSRDPVSEKTSSPKIEYELDLTERCKDWIYFRNKAYKLAYKGDEEGAREAGKMMQRFYNDLKIHFSPEEISAELTRLEQEKMAQN